MAGLAQRLGRFPAPLHQVPDISLSMNVGPCDVSVCKVWWVTCVVTLALGSP